MATMNAREFDLERDGARMRMILSGSAFATVSPSSVSRFPRYSVLAFIVLAAVTIGAVLVWRERIPEPAVTEPLGVTLPTVPSLPRQPRLAVPSLPRQPRLAVPTLSPIPVPVPAAEPVAHVASPALAEKPVHRRDRHRPKVAPPVREARVVPHAEPVRAHALAGAIAEPLAGAALRAAQDRDAQRARELNRREFERIGGGRSD